MQREPWSTVKLIERPCNGKPMVGISNGLSALRKDRIERGGLIEGIVSTEVILRASLCILPTCNGPALTIEGGVIWYECRMRIIHLHLSRHGAKKRLLVFVDKLHPCSTCITNREVRDIDICFLLTYYRKDGRTTSIFKCHKVTISVFIVTVIFCFTIIRYSPCISIRRFNSNCTIGVITFSDSNDYRTIYRNCGFNTPIAMLHIMIPCNDINGR